MVVQYPATERTVTTRPLHRKPNVLAVDDKRANLLALEVTLGESYNVLLAASGAQAIEMLRKHPLIDLILMDVQMPDKDGFEVAAEIKRMDGCPDIPIIFITAVYREDPFVKKGYEVGGIDYFTKPFDPEILKMKVAVYASYRLKEEVLRERERHVRESEELLRVGRKLAAVLEDLPVGVLIADVEGRICQTTEAVTRIFSATAPAAADAYGEILGWWDGSGQLIRSEDGPLARAIRHGESSQGEPLAIRCLDGSSKTVLISASPLRNLQGEIVGGVLLVQDLTGAKLVEKDLQQRVARLVTAGVQLEESLGR